MNTSSTAKGLGIGLAVKAGPAPLVRVQFAFFFPSSERRAFRRPVDPHSERRGWNARIIGRRHRESGPVAPGPPSR